MCSSDLGGGYLATGSGGYFTELEPDVMLTEVHRQAADNPIVRMSMIVREGGRLERGIYGESRVIARSEIDPQVRTDLADCGVAIDCVSDTDLNALGFHQRSSKEYFEHLRRGVTQALDRRDSSFGDYRTKETDQ